MANHRSALKRFQQSEKRRIHNKIYRTRARSYVKKARAVIAGGNDLEAAKAATAAAVRDLDMAASRGTIHPNNAARRKSRLMKQLAALEAQSK